MKTISISIILVVLVIINNSVFAYDGTYLEYSQVHHFTQNLHVLEPFANLYTDLILSTQIASNSSTSSGIIVPLYDMPGNDWDRVIQTKIAHPSVPILGVINLENGSGHFQNPEYTEA